MDWLAANFTKYPELPVFLVVGIGYSGTVAIGHILLTTLGTVIVQPLT
jgi:hypothetical protein